MLHLRELRELYQLYPVLYETSSNTFQYDLPAEDKVKKSGDRNWYSTDVFHQKLSAVTAMPH